MRLLSLLIAAPLAAAKPHAYPFAQSLDSPSEQPLESALWEFANTIIPGDSSFTDITDITDITDSNSTDSNSTDSTNNPLFVSRAGHPWRPLQIRLHYSNREISIGDMDLFQAIWQAGFSGADDAGIERDNVYKANHYACLYSDMKPNYSIRVKMEGSWGNVGKVNGWVVRNQLITSLWQIVNRKLKHGVGVLWTDCAYCGWSGCSDNRKAACGSTFHKSKCACHKYQGGGGENEDTCYGSRTMFRVPSEINIAIYNSDGSLRADHLHISFSVDNVNFLGFKCGRLFAVGEVLIGIIPEFGLTLRDIATVGCRGLT